MKNNPLTLFLLLGFLTIPVTGVPATFLSDQFTVASDTALEDHSPNTTGSQWGTGTTENQQVTIDATNDEAYADNSQSAWIANPTTPGSANYSCEGTVKTGDTVSGNNAGVLVRSDANDATFDAYLLYVFATGTVFLERFINGTQDSSLGSYAIPGFSATTFYDVRLDVEGTGATVTLRGYVDDACVIPATDCVSTGYEDTHANRIVATGFAGAYLKSKASGNYPRLTELICIDDTSAGPSIPLMRRRGR